MAEKPVKNIKPVVSGGGGATKIADADIAKFSEYIFKEGAEHGKNVVFTGLGYSKEHSVQLMKIYQEQASQKFLSGNYTLGKLDSYGQRINIGIELPGIGSAAGKTSYLNSGWMILKDGTIKLNTPFSGFYK
jgi:filamentous hemagglutinin